MWRDFNVKTIPFPLSWNTFLFEEVSVYPSLFLSILPQFAKSHTTPYHWTYHLNPPWDPLLSQQKPHTELTIQEVVVSKRKSFRHIWIPCMLLRKSMISKIRENVTDCVHLFHVVCWNSDDHKFIGIWKSDNR